jgi:hypothetical protein
MISQKVDVEILELNLQTTTISLQVWLPFLSSKQTFFVLHWFIYFLIVVSAIGCFNAAVSLATSKDAALMWAQNLAKGFNFA